MPPMQTVAEYFYFQKYGTPIIEVYGNAVLIANGDASPSGTDHTDFGSLTVPVTVTKIYTIENVGDADLESLTVSAPSGYTVTVQPTSPVAPGNSTTFSVRFNASSAGTFAGNISIASNVADYTFAITALGVVPVVEVYGNSILIANGDATPSATDHTDFGTTGLSTTVTRTFTIKNTGAGQLNSLVVTAPSGYTVTVQPTSPVATNGTTTFSVRFNTSSYATYSGNISIASNTTTYSFAITGVVTYAATVLLTNPKAYWKMNEGSGTALIDSSSSALPNGTYTGITWTAAASRLGGYAPSFDGINDSATPYSAALQAIMNEDEGCLLVWLKVSGSGVWTDGAFREIFRMRNVAGTTIFFIRKNNTNNQVAFVRGAIGVAANFSGSTAWIGALMSYSVNNNQFILVSNGAQVGTTQTGLTTMTGAITSFYIGSADGGIEIWSGCIEQIAYWDTPIANLNDPRVALTVG